MKRKLSIRPPCGCGCGNRTMLNTKGTEWNKYISGHTSFKISEKCLEDFLIDGFTSKEIAAACDMKVVSINQRIRKRGGDLHISRVKGF